MVEIGKIYEYEKAVDPTARLPLYISNQYVWYVYKLFPESAWTAGWTNINSGIWNL